MVLQKSIITFRPRQNVCHFSDDIFKSIFLNENVWISIKISLKFVPGEPNNNFPSLVQIIAWRRPGDKPLSELMMVSLLTHICVTRSASMSYWKSMNRLMELDWRSSIIRFVTFHIYIYGAHKSELRSSISMDGDYMDKRRVATFESTWRHKTIVFCWKLFNSEHVPSNVQRNVT